MRRGNEDEKVKGSDDMKLIIGAGAFVVMNLICFLLMRHDKQCYRQRKRRVPQRTLFLSAGLFGALGGTLAMQIYHHKKNHWQFRTFFPTMMILQIVIFGFAVYKWLL